MVTAAALYARISLDRLGTERGVQRQLEDARELAAQRGWQIAGEYVDNDVSAYNGKKARESYRRLMADAEAQRFDRIVVFQTSRLWRNRSERAGAITRLGQLKIGIATVKGPELDLSTAYGRGVASLMTEFDTMESEIKSERQIRANLQKAQEGRAAAFVPYGWRRVYEVDAGGRVTGFRDVEDLREAMVVRGIVKRLLRGQTMRAILRNLNDHQVPAPRRKPGFHWSYAGLKNLVLRPANVALRVHHGGILGPAAWPPILQRDEYDRAVALLTAPGRRQRRDGLRHHLLTFGIGECGVCGGRLSARTAGSHRDRRGPRRAIYRCAGEKKACVQRDQAKVDELVGLVLVEYLAQPDSAGVFDADDSTAKAARAQAEAIRARLDNAADQYADGAIDGAQLARITARLRPELEAAEAEARRRQTVPLPPEVDGLLTARATAVWAALPVTAKRSVLEALGFRVIIHPRTKSGPGFEPETVEVKVGK